jgi:hypothetical protein
MADEGVARIVAVVLLADDEHRIRAVLESLMWTAEQLAVDLGCRDGTVEICRRRGLTVLEPDELPGELARRRADWVLFVEGHEEVPVGLAGEARAAVDVARRDGAPDAYAIAREVHFLGRDLRSRTWSAARWIRLIRPGAIVWPGRLATIEAIGSAGPVGRLARRLRAQPYASLHHYVRRVDVLTGAAAAARRGGAAPLRWSGLVGRPLLDGARVVLLGGLRDGVVGMMFAVLEAYRLVLVAAKCWELAHLTEGPRPTES